MGITPYHVLWQKTLDKIQGLLILMASVIEVCEKPYL